MDIYSAKEFIKLMTSGTTNPWLVRAEKQGMDFELVVKNFKPDVETHMPIFKEFFCATLARELDLSVPDFGLFECGPEFLKTLPFKLNQYQGNSHMFCTKLMVGCPTYAKSTGRRVIQLEDMESIFAFDILIWNVDRVAVKPNILVGSNAYYLIDHELTISGLTNFESHILDFSRFARFTSGQSMHLFYKSLQKTKNAGFGTFHELLMRLDITAIDTKMHELSEFGVNVEDYTFVREYLIAAKQNSGKFINLLKQLLQ